MTTKKVRRRHPTDYDIEGIRATSRAVGFLLHRAEKLHERFHYLVGYGVASDEAMSRLKFFLLQAKSVLDGEAERFAATKEVK